MFERDSKIVKMIAPSWPKIEQLRLILIIVCIVLVAWLISLCGSANHSAFNEMAWCAEWDARTVNEWAYSEEWGCVQL